MGLWRRPRRFASMGNAMPHYLISRKRIRTGTRRVQCQYSWMSGCYQVATWRVGCGPDVRYFCDEHEGPPCGGVFIGSFVIMPEMTQEVVARVRRCGAHRIESPSGRDVHELLCCACGEWIGDAQDPEIQHVSVPLQAECLPNRSRVADDTPCRACEETPAAMQATTATENP